MMEGPGRFAYLCAAAVAIWTIEAGPHHAETETTLSRIAATRRVVERLAAAVADVGRLTVGMLADGMRQLAFVSMAI
jgi:hypothetical protein